MVHVGEVPNVKLVFVAVAYQVCDDPVFATGALHENEPVTLDEPVQT